MRANKRNLMHLQLNKSILFVDDDLAACAVARRMAGIFGVDVQTANSAHAALALLEHNPREFFLVLTDEIMPVMTGTELLVIVKKRWPYIRRSLISGVSDPQIIEKAEKEAEIYRYLKKPVSDLELRDLLESACDDFISGQVSCLDLIVAERVKLINNSFERLLSTEMQHLMESFPECYLVQCERIWKLTKRYQNKIGVQESSQFQEFLAQRIDVAINRISNRSFDSGENIEVKLSSLLKHFGVKCLKKHDRYIRANESAMVAMCSIMKDYYSILGLMMPDMVSAHDRYISLNLGGRFTYNDLFNPLLSSVARGAELACLKLELFMLAHIANIPVEMSVSKQFSIRVIV